MPAKPEWTTIQTVQFLDKTAKFQEHLGRRETWSEAVDRTVTSLREQLVSNLGSKSQESVDWGEISDGILALEVLPSMRLMQMAGPALERENLTAYNCVACAIDSPDSFVDLFYALMQTCGTGYSVERQFVNQMPAVERQHGGEARVYVIPDSTEGWCTALKNGLAAWFAGQDIKFVYDQIRPQGARLKTKGGYASGPEPLRKMLDFVRSKMLDAQGRKLRPIECHDIMCMIGDIVHVGGVRRAALCSLSDLDDEEMAMAKYGDSWFKDHLYRQMANNSAVVYGSRLTYESFKREWDALSASGSGERGLVNRESITLSARRPYRDDYVFNPCVTDDTWIATADGLRQVRDLIGKPFAALIGGRQYSSAGFFKTGNKPVCEMSFSSGLRLRVTGDHLITTQNRGDVAARDLTTADDIVVSNQRAQNWDINLPELHQGWLIGELLGDGNITNKAANLDFWGQTKSVMADLAAHRISSTVGSRSDCLGNEIPDQDKIRISSVGLLNLARSLGIESTETKQINQLIESQSPSFLVGMLRGYFDADGSPQGNHDKGVSVRLTSVKLGNLEACQRMLLLFGINSKIYQNRAPARYTMLPDGRGGEKAYWCQPAHELVIANDSLQRYASIIGFDDPAKKERLANFIAGYNRTPNRDKFVTSLVDRVDLGEREVYDCSVPGISHFVANGIEIHNCFEIGLRGTHPLGGGQCCNLSQAVARPSDTMQSLAKKVRLASIIGTIQSAMTNFRFVRPGWKANCEEERLLGVDISGQMDTQIVGRFVDPELLLLMKNLAVITNKEFAKKLGINQSAAVTCNKPNGNSSVLLGVSSGLHARPARHYIQRMRMMKTSPIAAMLRDAGVPYATAYGSDTLDVFEFPVAAPHGATVAGEMTAIEQLERWRLWKTHFTEHNPSTSIYVKQHEWPEVGAWVYANIGIVGGLSFFPFDDHVYPQAPWEPITHEEYLSRKASMPSIQPEDLEKYENRSTGELLERQQEFACAGAQCML